MPSNNRDYTVEREARREDTRRKRQERVMCAYVKHAHPAVYKEMCDVYNDLNEKYPKTRDLRKTPHFIRLRRKVVSEASEKNTSEFSLRTPLRRKVVSEASEKNTNVFSLRIPLMKATTTTLTPAAVSSPPVAVSSPSVAVSQSPVAVSSPSVAVSQSPVAVSSPSVAVSQSPVAVSSPSVAVLPPVPDDIYEGLLEEIRKDSNLWEIFQDFPGQEMDPLVAEDLGDITGISPLEAELS